MRTLLFAAFAALAAITLAQAQSTPPKSPPLSDNQFVEKAITGNRFEVESGRLAQSKATDAKLKQFADMMVMDHGNALKDLQGVAQDIKAPMPDKLDAQRQAKLDALKSKDAAAFDAAYKADMKSSHAETLAMLKTHRASTRNDKLKAWIDKTLPTVEKHKAAIDSM